MYAFGSGKEVSLVQKLLRRGDGGRRERRQGSHDRAHRRQGSHTRAHLVAGSHDVIPQILPAGFDIHRELDHIPPGHVYYSIIAQPVPSRFVLKLKVPHLFLKDTFMA